MIYVTSDTHYGHGNTCGPDGFLDTRTHFTNVDEMDKVMIDNHNAVVGEHDTTIHLGDISFHYTKDELYDLFKKLNGHFILVSGNHEVQRMLNHLMKNNYNLGDGKKKFLEIHDVGFRQKIAGKFYLFTHYPMHVGEYQGRFRNIHGHIHTAASAGGNMLNVGVDSPELGERPFGAPIPLSLAVELVEEKWERTMSELNNPS